MINNDKAECNICGDTIVYPQSVEEIHQGALVNLCSMEIDVIAEDNNNFSQYRASEYDYRICENCFNKNIKPLFTSAPEPEISGGCSMEVVYSEQ